MKTIYSPSFFSIIPNLLMLKPLFYSEKIIIHSLASPFLLLYLTIFPSLAKKSYWVIWGKDLYFYKLLINKRFYHKIYEHFRRKAIPRIGHIITFSKGDYELSKSWYKSNAIWHKSFMYPSNLYKDIEHYEKKKQTKTILIGNSADPSNNHIESFSILEKYKYDDIELVTPLSYGDRKYSKNIIKYGKKLFGEKYKPIETFLPLTDYLDLLNRVDIAIFAHDRQQATGNIITLLGMKKKVYIKNNISTWAHLKSFDIEIFDILNFNLSDMDERAKQKNNAIIKNIFSEENLIKQWHEIANYVD